jgi:hypothetical protein
MLLTKVFPKADMGVLLDCHGVNYNARDLHKGGLVLAAGLNKNFRPIRRLQVHYPAVYRLDPAHHDDLLAYVALELSEAHARRRVIAIHPEAIDASKGAHKRLLIVLQL